MDVQHPPEGGTVEYMEAKKRRGGLSGALMFVIIVVAVIFVMSVSFRVENIQVVGNNHYTASEIINAILHNGFSLERFDEHPAWENEKLPGEFTAIARRKS